MKDLLVQKSMIFIQKNTDYNKDRLEIINYGLQGLYSTIIKLTVTIIIAAAVGLLKELLLFMLFYSFLRTFASGFHASNNLQCWLFSVPSFIGISLLIKYLYLPNILIILISIFSGILLICFSPADTVKKPMIRKNIRIRNKIITLLITLTYILIISILTNSYIKYSLLYSIIWQSIIVNPLLYYIFKQPYNNYKNYKEKNM